MITGIIEKTSSCIDQARPKQEIAESGGVKEGHIGPFRHPSNRRSRSRIDGPGRDHIGPHRGEVGSAGHTHPLGEGKLHFAKPRCRKALSVHSYSLVTCSTTLRDFISGGNTSHV